MQQHVVLLDKFGSVKKKTRKQLVPIELRSSGSDGFTPSTCAAVAMVLATQTKTGQNVRLQTPNENYKYRRRERKQFNRDTAHVR